PKRTKSFKWTANVEAATLGDLKEHIREEYNPVTLENDGAVLKAFTVIIEIPSKAFSDWSFPKVCQLYGLGESDDPSLSVFPPFTCEYKELKTDSSQAILKHLIAELEARPNGRGPVDFAIDLLQTAKTVGVTVVKDEDFYKGIAQNAVQLESALSN
ncbi:9177_t:CDS:2, partial [Ambispora leptoticha]